MGLQLFEWNDRFATGVELIDRQHRSLLQMTNELGDAITRGDAAAGERLLQGLSDYALHHFRDEEAWALAAGVPAAVLDAHHGRHEAFVTELGQFSDLWAQDGHHARTLHRFLSAWLITHILGEDRRMVLGISGLPGSDVQAPTALGDGEQVLLQAVNNLHDALASANADLERRVTERTAELAAANQRLRHNLIAAVKVFSGMIQLRGSRLAAHSRRVADMARHIAVTLKLPQADVDQVFVAGLLHDIGKVGLPDELLDMPMTHMNSQQLQLYQKHTVHGERAMMALDELREAALMVRGHHERFDGKGFPDRLSGEHIPLGARILFAANDWDELLHGRKGGRGQAARGGRDAVRPHGRHRAAGPSGPGWRCRCGASENPAQQRTGCWYGAGTRPDRPRRPAAAGRGPAHRGGHDPPHPGLRAERSHGQPARAGHRRCMRS